VPSYLVESTVASSREAFADSCGRARRVSLRGDGVRYLRTTLLPGDEVVLHVFDAPSAQALAAAVLAVGLEFEQIVQAGDTEIDRRKET
jgi:hypothetical protein